MISKIKRDDSKILHVLDFLDGAAITPTVFCYFSDGVSQSDFVINPTRSFIELSSSGTKVSLTAKTAMVEYCLFVRSAHMYDLILSKAARSGA